MNGMLLLSILFHCTNVHSYTTCVRAKLECAALNNAYSSDENKATQVVAGCLVKEGK